MKEQSKIKISLFLFSPQSSTQSLNFKTFFYILNQYEKLNTSKNIKKICTYNTVFFGSRYIYI